MATHAPAVLPPRSSKYVNIALRVFTAAFLFMSLVILVTNVRSNFVSTNKTLHFYDLVGYRYMAAAVVIGLAYSILQTVIAVIRIKKYSQGNILLDSTVVSTIIATGAVAGFVMTGELQKYIGKDWTDYYHTYFRMSHAADGLAFLGFVCAFISSIISWEFSKMIVNQIEVLQIVPN